MTKCSTTSIWRNFTSHRALQLRHPSNTAKSANIFLTVHIRGGGDKSVKTLQQGFQSTHTHTHTHPHTHYNSHVILLYTGGCVVTHLINLIITERKNIFEIVFRLADSPFQKVMLQYKFIQFCLFVFSFSLFQVSQIATHCELGYCVVGWKVLRPTLLEKHI